MSATQDTKEITEKVYWPQSQKLIAGQVQTVSKHPCRSVDGYPKYIRSGNGCYVEDYDGNIYVDFICSLGPIVLGHNYKTVTNAVKSRIEKGTIFSQSAIEEVTLARQLNYFIPSAKMVRYFKTGSDANSAAIRLARAYTGKDKILVCGYHGWHDWYQGVNPQNKGIPKVVKDLAQKFIYNDLQSVTKLFESDDVAAIILEPTRFEEPKDNFLQNLRDVCNQHGALLIFDEIITGFRFHIGGAQSYFGVVPDLSTFSKAMGNGYPIAALVGQEQYMRMFDDPEFFASGTFAGDLVGITAAIETIKALNDNNNHKIKMLWKYGNELKEGFNLISHKLGINAQCEGYGPLTRFVLPSVEHRGLFYQLCIKSGVMFGPTNFINSCHSTIVIQGVLNRIDEILTKMKEVWNDPKIALTGESPKEIVLR